MTLKIDKTRVRTGFVRMSSSSAFQSKGHTQELFHPRDSQNYISVHSDIDSTTQIYSFRKERVRVSKLLNTNITFATSRQSILQIRCNAEIP